MSADVVVVDPRLVRSLQARVAEMLTIEHQRRERRGDLRLTGEDEHQLALALIDQVVADELEQSVRNGADLPADRGYDQRLAASVHAAMFGAGELQELLDDQAVENININGCDEV
jgi:hypothetical protein